MCDLGPASRARHCGTEQGLKQHKLVAHGVSCSIRLHIVSSQCTACSFDYGSRFRALRHARNDSVRCRDKILAGQCLKPRDELLAAADLADREIVRVARKAGKTPGRAVAPGPKPGPKKANYGQFS